MRPHSTQKKNARGPRTLRGQIATILLACAATLAGLPVDAAVSFPPNPLQDGSTIPPNVMFILDNSGSMALISMPFDVQDQSYSGTGTGADRTGLRDDPYDRSYLNNTIYYNPNINYQPWMTADGVTRLTGGQNVTSVYTSWNQASTTDGTRDLRDSGESVFYVPKAGVTASTNRSDFVRYWIRNAGGTAQVVREPATVTDLQTWSWTQNIDEGDWVYRNINVPAGTTELVVQIAGNTNNRGNADLYVRRAGNPTTGTYDYRSASNNSDESITVSAPQTGTWYIGVYNRDSGSGDRRVYNNRLDIVARNNVEVATPTGRSQAAELTNFATWYSYHRSRLKTAKAGASEAFASLGRDFRVGYTPINGRSSHLSSTGTNPIIPVNTDDGLFGGTNKTGWFSTMQSEYVQAGSTPLRTTLNAVGQYYTRQDANGPWGPQATANQLSCRQSFAILTTDGYWNDSTSSTFGMGDEDGDGNSVTLADVASHYYGVDLRGDLTNNVPDSIADPAYWQHMVTFGISIGLQGNVTPTDPPPASNAAIWPNPMDAENADRIDDLYHASVNGHGKFVTASNTDQFTRGLRDALAAIAERQGAASNVSANSTSVGTDTRVYQAIYNTGRWTGELKAFPVTSSGVATTEEWEASRLIPAHTARRIFTNTNATSGAATGREFLWANLTPAQQTALGGPTNGPIALGFLRGDGSQEIRNGGSLRDRAQRSNSTIANVLGDIVHSSPVFVDIDPDGNPSTNDGSRTVYVGANDGMLHAFDATNGVERFAYVPAGIDFASLSTLTAPDYAHRYFVDGEIAVSTREQTPGRNILVGLLGRGGKSVYALDVSNPGSFGASNVLWEFSDPDLGNALGEPIITKLNNGQTGVIIGNGYNSVNGRSVVFILNIETGALIRKFDTGVGVDNGMSSPRGWDANRSGTFDFIYAGDLRGNVWKLDISSTSALAWRFSVTSGGVPTPIFQARDSGGNVQPITAGIALGLDPNSFTRWVFFGTGRYLTADDPQNRSVQSWYGFQDDAIDTPAEVLARSNLKSRAIVESTTANGQRVRAFEAATAGDMLGKKGWVIDLEVPANTLEGSERIITRSVFAGSILLASSIIPSSDACGTGGRGYLNAIDPFTGGSSSFYDLNGDGVVDAADQINGKNVGSIDPGTGMPSMPVVLKDNPGGKVKVIVGGSAAGRPEDIQGVLPGAWGRISWREILRD